MSGVAKPGSGFAKDPAKRSLAFAMRVKKIGENWDSVLVVCIDEKHDSTCILDI